MNILTDAMRIINENSSELPVRDGCGIVLPVPGLECGQKVSKTFACPMSTRAPVFGSPVGKYILDLENGMLVRADPVNVFQDRAPVVLETDTPDFRRQIAEYTEAYPRFFSLVFQENADASTLNFCRETFRLLEKAMDRLNDYYRWLSPELYDWLAAGDS